MAGRPICLGWNGASWMGGRPANRGTWMWFSLAIFKKRSKWRLAVEENGDFLPAQAALADLCQGQGRWAEVEPIAQAMDRLGEEGELHSAVVRGRAHLARREFGEARHLLEGCVARFPKEIRPRVVLSHALLQEGQDWEAAEQALREVLRLDPGQEEAANNLMLLLERRGKTEDLARFREEVLAQLYQSACTTPSDIHEQCPTLYQLARECRHVTEMGTRAAVSTTALMYARPEKLVCYDLHLFPQVERLGRLAGPTTFGLPPGRCPAGGHRRNRPAIH
jgi:tetratricopeptide (TPR) repeat protein